MSQVTSELNSTESLLNNLNFDSIIFAHQSSLFLTHTLSHTHTFFFLILTMNNLVELVPDVRDKCPTVSKSLYRDPRYKGNA